MNVIVIGAGVIGAASADALAAAGHKVHVLDMRGPGRGASHASAGVLALSLRTGLPLTLEAANTAYRLFAGT